MKKETIIIAKRNGYYVVRCSCGWTHIEDRGLTNQVRLVNTKWFAGFHNQEVHNNSYKINKEF